MAGDRMATLGDSRKPMNTMQHLVIGAGAWGLPAATRLAEAGHAVTLIDRWGPGNPLSSSPGPSRIWRLLDHRPERVELSRHGLEALERSERAAGEQLFTRSGMLWRHEASNDAVAAGLEAAGTPFTRVVADLVGEYFPGFRPNETDAIWCDVAGTVLADRVIASELRRFQAAGGVIRTGREVASVHPDDSRPSVVFSDGTSLDADVITIAAGMGAKALLDPLLPAPLPFVTRLEQVVHFGTRETLSVTNALPCVFDGAGEHEPDGMYGMATPDVGFKFGLDVPIREFSLTDLDRTPSAERTALMRDRVARDFTIEPVVVDATCCNWTDSPDGEFVLDRLPGNIVVGAGDSGEGFKFTSLIGEILAGLAQEAEPVVPLEHYRVDRFAKQPDLTPDTSGSSLSHRRFGQ